MNADLLGSAFSNAALEPLIDARAWVQAMLDFEAALARAQARVGVIPAEAAAAIAAACRAERIDLAQIREHTIQGGNPVIPLVKQLTAAVPSEAAVYVHWGATSQDVIDTALMLVVRQASTVLLHELVSIEQHCAQLAEQHQHTVMIGRTLLQQALPITFGLKAAGWLSQLHRVRLELERMQAEVLTLQFGGAVGTLASLGDKGLAVLRELAAELELAEPDLPWHSARDRVARIVSVLGLMGGALGKIALDTALLMQTEVAELMEPGGPGQGGSSTMPHKRNPVLSTLTLTAVRRLQALIPVAYESMLQEHERAIGNWHAEWETVSDALRLTAAASQHIRVLTAGLSVDSERMRRNLGLTQGLVMAEAVMMALAPVLGREPAHAVVEAACQQALSRGMHLRDVLMQDQRLVEQLGEARLAALFEPENYLGATPAFIARALDAARKS